MTNHHLARVAAGGIPDGFAAATFYEAFLAKAGNLPEPPVHGSGSSDLIGFSLPTVFSPVNSPWKSDLSGGSSEAYDTHRVALTRLENNGRGLALFTSADAAVFVRRRGWEQLSAPVMEEYHTSVTLQADAWTQVGVHLRAHGPHEDLSNFPVRQLELLDVGEQRNQAKDGYLGLGDHREMVHAAMGVFYSPMPASHKSLAEDDVTMRVASLKLIFALREEYEKLRVERRDTQGTYQALCQAHLDLYRHFAQSNDVLLTACASAALFLMAHEHHFPSGEHYARLGVTAGYQHFAELAVGTNALAVANFVGRRLSGDVDPNLQRLQDYVLGALDLIVGRRIKVPSREARIDADFSGGLSEAVAALEKRLSKK